MTSLEQISISDDKLIHTLHKAARDYIHVKVLPDIYSTMTSIFFEIDRQVHISTYEVIQDE